MTRGQGSRESDETLPKDQNVIRIQSHRNTEPLHNTPPKVVFMSVQRMDITSKQWKGSPEVKRENKSEKTGKKK